MAAVSSAPAAADRPQPELPPRAAELPEHPRDTLRAAWLLYNFINMLIILQAGNTGHKTP